mgnify:FL=1
MSILDYTNQLINICEAEDDYDDEEEIDCSAIEAEYAKAKKDKDQERMDELEAALDEYCSDGEEDDTSGED